MNWYLWFLAAWFLANAVVTVTTVGKPRKTLTADVAASVVIINAALIAGIFIIGAR